MIVMPIPAEITLVTVTATYLRPDGSPASGRVSFVPSQVNALADTVLTTWRTTSYLNSDGELSVQLPATDDASWEAPGWSYRVIEQIDGADDRRYDITVPAASPTLDLATAAPLAEPATASSYVLRSNIGTLVPPLVAGKVPESYLPASAGGDPEWEDIQNKPATFPPATHTHEGSGGAAIAVVRRTVTSGNITPQSTGSWAMVTGGPTIAIAAAAGDYVSFEICSALMRIVSSFRDLAVVVGGVPVRYLSTGSSSSSVEGAPAFYGDSTFRTHGTAFDFVVQNSDLSGGNVTVGFATKGAADGTIYASTDYPLVWRAMNYGAISVS